MLGPVHENEIKMMRTKKPNKSKSNSDEDNGPHCLPDDLDSDEKEDYIYCSEKKQLF